LYTHYNRNIESSLLILNTIGHLASAYHYADVAFIGGGFTGRLHNILEPLSFGVPVLTGPVHSKFPEAEMAKEAGVLFEVKDAEQFSEQLLSVDFNALRKKAEAFIQSRAGASDIVIGQITGKL
jgi:3-deoxy-D-manno-octulosonic-acid transferase